MVLYDKNELEYVRGTLREITIRNRKSSRRHHLFIGGLDKSNRSGEYKEYSNNVRVVNHDEIISDKRLYKLANSFYL